MNMRGSNYHLKNLQKKAQSLGFDLVAQSSATQSVSSQSVMSKPNYPDEPQFPHQHNLK